MGKADSKTILIPEHLKVKGHLIILMNLILIMVRSLDYQPLSTQLFGRLALKIWIEHMAIRVCVLQKKPSRLPK